MCSDYNHGIDRTANIPKSPSHLHHLRNNIKLPPNSTVGGGRFGGWLVSEYFLIYYSTLHYGHMMDSYVLLAIH